MHAFSQVRPSSQFPVRIRPRSSHVSTPTLLSHVKLTNYFISQKTLTPKQWEKEQANKLAAEKVLLDDAKAAAEVDKDPEVKNA